MDADRHPAAAARSLWACRRTGSPTGNASRRRCLRRVVPWVDICDAYDSQPCRPRNSTRSGPSRACCSVASNSWPLSMARSCKPLLRAAQLFAPTYDKFAALNAACWSGGTLLYVPDGG